VKPARFHSVLSTEPLGSWRYFARRAGSSLGVGEKGPQELEYQRTERLPHLRRPPSS